MGTFIYFTEEQKRQANEVDLAEFLQRQGEKILPSGRDYRLDSDHSVTIRGSEWFDHETQTGGHAIDFVRTHYGMTFPEAVTILLGGEQGQCYPQAREKAPLPTKPFVLPPANRNMRRVYAYLMKHRHIDRDVITYFARAGCSMKMKRTTTWCLSVRMRPALPAMRTSGAPTALERRSVKTWRAAIPDTASTTWAETEACLYLRRPLTFCRISPSTQRIGTNTAMWPAAERLPFRC